MGKATPPAPAGSRIAPSSQAIRLRNTPTNTRGDPTRQSAKQHARRADSALAQGDAGKARGYADKLRGLNPEAPEVEALAAAIARLEREAAEAEARRKEEEQRRREAMLRADDAAFEQAESEGTPEGYESYLDAYPSGRHVVEARRLRDEAAERRIEELRRWTHGEQFRDCEVCPLMVVVRAGSYMMGSPSSDEGRRDNEGPVHRVRIAEPFAVGVYEVTFAEWDACVSDGGCGGHRPVDGRWGRGKRPVIDVSWEDARAYVGWLSRKTGKGYRLLSESEWEYVARAGTGTRYWWGDSIGSGRANCDGCGSRWDDEQTAPVGSFPANGFGLHDVHGNVWEWVEDCWHDDYRGAPSDGSAWTTWTSGGECSQRMLRGGSWDDAPRFLRSANRSGRGNRSVYLGSVDLGFRVARTLTP